MGTLQQTNLKSVSERATFTDFVSQADIRNKINSVVGGEGGQRFIASIISAVNVNPALQECTYGTILSAAFLGEALKLSPSPQLGHYYIVPFKDKNSVMPKANFILGYKGYIQLAIRSGQYKKLTVLAIKEGELLCYNPLTEELKINLIQNDIEREKTPTVGYYAMFELTNGFSKTLYWSKDKMLVHADRYSAAFNLKKATELWAGKIPMNEAWKYSSFWYKDFDGMAYKTLLRQLISKWGIMSIEMQNAIENDGDNNDMNITQADINGLKDPLPSIKDGSNGKTNGLSEGELPIDGEGEDLPFGDAETNANDSDDVQADFFGEIK
jgi:recombination protein RecT